MMEYHPDLLIPLPSLEELSLGDLQISDGHLGSPYNFSEQEQSMCRSWDNDHQAQPEHLTQWLLKRTLDASLLHDDTCSYDYISYLDKISCSVCI